MEWDAKDLSQILEKEFNNTLKGLYGELDWHSQLSV